jgi:hypothetical protein
MFVVGLLWLPSEYSTYQIMLKINFTTTKTNNPPTKVNLIHWDYFVHVVCYTNVVVNNSSALMRFRSR